MTSTQLVGRLNPSSLELSEPPTSQLFRGGPRQREDLQSTQDPAPDPSWDYVLTVEQQNTPETPAGRRNEGWLI